VKALQAANPSVVPSKLKVGSKIQVPEKAEGTSTSHTPIASASGDLSGTATPAAGVTTSTYIVKPGDTLTKIAAAHGVKVKELQTLNHMTTTVVQANHKLKIPVKGSSAHAEKVPVTTDLSTNTAGNTTPVVTNGRTGLSTNR
jgi:LysM repeat protein